MRHLEPRDDFQRALYAQTLQIGIELGQKRSLLLEETGGSIPAPFLVVLVFWLALIFASFGLFAPTNSTVVGVLLACALSVCRGYFPNHGIGSAVSEATPDFQHAATQCAHASWQITPSAVEKRKRLTCESAT